VNRRSSFSGIAPDIGKILLFLSAISSTPLLVAVFYREWHILVPMGAVPCVFGILGLYLQRIPHTSRETKMSVAISAVAIVWFLAALVGALPFALILGMPFSDCVFEAMSGWTSTGLTLLPSVDNAPHALLFWRTLMQWVGGLGIIAFTISMWQRSGLVQRGLYRSEGRSEAFMPNVTATAAKMWTMYILITLISILLISVSGIPLWDSLNIAMAAIATGGFSVHTEGILYYKNPLLEMLVIPVMIAGALPFKLYYYMYLKRQVNIFRDPQARLLITLILLGFAIVFYDLVTGLSFDTTTAFRQSIFMVTSAITCTGFQNGNPFVWSGATVLFFSALMLIGGATGSTAGGIKLNRILLAKDSMLWWFKRIFLSSRVVIPFHHDGKTVPINIAEVEVSKNMLIIILFILTVFFGSLAILHFESVGPYESSDVIFEVASAMCNVGVSTGFVNPGMSLLSKWLFILVMWIGRLEIVPVLVLLTGSIRGFE
jgi:trk system potassium uptake protein TrkH